MTKKEQTKSVTKWDEEFAKQAVEASKGFEPPSAKFISLKGGKMSFGGATIPDNELMAVVFGATHENQYYDPDVPYDPETPQVPMCYAFGTEVDEMSPHENSSEPQNEGCKGCQWNEFESAERGRGKACKNVLRLALIAADEAEDLEKSEIVYIKVPVMSVRNWGAYVKSLKIVKRPYFAVVTKISLEPDEKSQFRLNFQFEENIDMDPRTLGDKHKVVMEGIDFPYAAVQEREVKTKKDKKPAKFSKHR